MRRSQTELKIGLNAVISPAGLIVNGQLMLLGHSTRFVQVVQMTLSAVVHVLSWVFPHAVAVPNNEGQAEASVESAWEHYLRHAQILQNVPAQSKAAQDASRIILQWCVAAQAAASVRALPGLSETKVLAVKFLSRYGPQAAVCSRAQWDAHRVWLLGRSLGGTKGIERISGPSPLPLPMRIVIPWPEGLGADMGGALKLRANICFLATSLQYLDGEACCSFQRHSLRVSSEVAQDWIARMDDQSTGEGDAPINCALTESEGGHQYAIRASRSRTELGDSYEFKLFNQG